MIIRGENSESLPIDLITEILSRLPAKSALRFRCVSKLWSSMLLRPDFTELFLTRSSARPRLLFAVERSDDWCFFTSPQPHDPYAKSSSSLVVAAEFHMKFPGDRWLEFRGRVSGLTCFCRSTQRVGEDKRIVICNPSTGQFTSLLLRGMPSSDWIPFLGFDPVDKQFKVLSIKVAYNGLNKESDQIMTLGTNRFAFSRKIHCPLIHFPRGEGICINGVLYYLATQIDLPSLVVCFDVRSEKFKFIHRDFISDQHNTKLINYKGKLGVITLEYDLDSYGRFRSLKLCMWVIEDVEKPESEWSMCWDDDDFVGKFYFSIVGATATGEIVLSASHAHDTCYVFFINPERKTVQSVEIQGLRANHFDSRGISEHRRVKVFVDHVEDLN